jgi:aspartate kinase
MGKTTNKLLAIAAEAVAGDRRKALELLADLREYHLTEGRQAAGAGRVEELEEIVRGLFQELEELIRGVSVLGELTPRATDAISSYGERLSSEIMVFALEAAAVPCVHVDSRDLIVTDNRHTQAVPLLPQTYSRLCATLPRLLNEGKVVVMGGFIGATEEGITSTLGRGGSDYTASIAGAGAGAEEIQIWTDVDGMLTADPSLQPKVYRVKTISFAEAAELAYFGAKVLHPSTVWPAIEKNIPVLILNSRRPDVDGTRIIRETVPCSNAAKSIAAKRRITLLNIVSTRMLMAHGFLRRIFEVFDRFETPVDMVATTEVSVSLTIDNPGRLREITRELRQFAEVTSEEDQAIVCIVGENIRYTPGVAGRVFQALRDVNVRMISQGASLLNLSVVVAQEDLPRAVERLHAEFFADPDPAVFAA